MNGGRGAAAGMRGADNQKRRSTRGESMVVAVVLMLVFFVLGLTVLTGASAANAGVNARVTYRQAYYYARSLLDVLDESLQNGALGKEIRGVELAKLQAMDADGVKKTQESYNIGYASGLPEGFSMEGASLQYDSEIVRSNNASARILLKNVKLSFRAHYQDQSYYVEAVYRYTVNAESNNNRWRLQNDGEWHVRSMS